MRTLTLRTGDAFGENELDPPSFIVALGSCVVLQRDNPNESMSDIRNAANELRRNAKAAKILDRKRRL